MIFGKKKGLVRRRRGSVDMIDIRELQRQGRVLGPEKQMPDLDVDSEGYVRVGAKASGVVTSSRKSDVSSADVANLLSSKSGSSGSFSIEKDGYSKREVDSKIQNLDNQIYKLEQRIDVLERKLGIDSGYSSPTPKSSSSGEGSGALGIMGW